MSHWYTRDAKPMHFVPSAKDGTMRDTTLRDARKLNLFCSVTTIGKVIAQPGLDNWKKEQAVIAALKYPGLAATILNDKQRLAEYIRWSIRESEVDVKRKAEEGNALHDSMELNFKDPDNVPPHHLAHVDAVNRLLVEIFGENRVWRSEETFVHETGFGGKIDLELNEPNTQPEKEILLDFKSKDFDETKKISDLVWDEHHIQLGGYAIGRNKRQARAFNVFISTTSPGLVRIYEHTPEELQWGIAVFEKARDLWIAKNKYKPTW